MGFLTGLINVLLVVSSLFLICLVLIQRGKGGGLAGAFGGVGGSSAFGTKAGDVFTRITIITAGVWFLLAISLVVLNNQTARVSAFDLDEAGASKTRDVNDGKGKAPSAADKAKAEFGGKAASGTGGAPTDSGTLAKPSEAKTDSSLPPVLEDEPAKSPAGASAPAKGKTP